MAGMDGIEGVPVSGSTNISGGTERINGPLAASKDDIADINAATQSALTIPVAKGTRTSWGQIMGKGQGGF